jgi:hypothetical protein
MRHGLIRGFLSVVVALLCGACVVPPSPQTPVPATVTVIPADARALRYGSTAPEVLANPALQDKVRALFGADWYPGTGRAYGAPAFFPPSSSIRMVRMQGREYIAITGCVIEACGNYRGLLLIGSEEQLMARLDDGGFSHYYDYGPNATGDTASRLALDGAWLALRGIERG